MIRRWLAAVAWFFLSLHLFLAEGWLVQAQCPAPDVTLAVCLHAAWFAPTGVLPLLLVTAGVARSVVCGGDAAVQVLLMGLPVALLFPLRGLLAPPSVVWQAVAAALLAAILPRLAAFASRFADAGAVVALTPETVLWAIVLTPLLAWLLRAAPPLRLLQRAPRRPR